MLLPGILDWIQRDRALLGRGVEGGMESGGGMWEIVG